MVKECHDKLEGELMSYELLLSILLGVWSRLAGYQARSKLSFGDRVCVIVLACTSLLLLLLNTVLNGADN